MSMSDNMSPVIRPIKRCWGSSPSASGSPRNVTTSKIGILAVCVSDVSGLTALPSPEFWKIATAGVPASCAPAAIATASPSLAAATYCRSGSSMARLINGFRKEQGTPA